MPDRSSLTPRQQAVLDMIRRHIADTGVPPTRAEIVQAFGFRSNTAAVDHLQALARKGAIELLEGSARGIRLTDAPPTPPVAAPRSWSVPLVGRVAAGLPILAQANVEAHFNLDPGLFRQRPDYLLRVRGWSMRDAGIDDGDLLAVRATPEALPRQIAVFRLDQEVTVKRYVPHPDRIELQSAHPDHPSIWVSASDPLVVEGVVVGWVRSV